MHHQVRISYSPACLTARRLFKMALSHPPKELYPTEIIFAPLVKEQRKKLIFRNDTPHRLALKLQLTVPSSVQLKHHVLELPPHSVTEDSFIYKPDVVGQSKQALLIFARPLSPENERTVRQWLKEPMDKEGRLLAFKLDFHTTSDRFNAQKIVLDLPGNASLHEGRSVLPTDIFTARSWPNLYQMARFEELKRAQMPPPVPKPAPPLRAVETEVDGGLWPLVEYILLFLLFLIAVIKLQFLH